MVPRNFAELEYSARQRTRTVFLFINLNVAMILLSLGFIFVAVRRERQLVQLKEDFIGNVSHELKTPLSMIRMFSEILVLGKYKNEEAEKEYFRIIHAESDRMGHLITNLLDFASLERESRPWNVERVRVGELIARVLEGYRPRMQKEGFQLTVAIDDKLPDTMADPNALTMAFLNLLDNSVKYSADHKQVSVVVRSSNGFIDLSVTDLGLGIPKAEQKRIFEKFYRGSTAAAQRIRGSGIGLSITKRVAEMHGGSVQVESEPGRGSTFTVRIPVTAPVQ
jgi:two-component system phosphate regulon sensor histidine kinase PhoR